MCVIGLRRRCAWGSACVLYATGPMGPVTGSVRVYAVYTDLRAEFLGHVSKMGAESGSVVDN